ncbi:MAG: hypothetical protein DCC65_09830 [Planctomycetota bacterium]|nr:MAG: hypothetical protein DCC65_09830 [Planctomycetota bacterium]
MIQSTDCCASSPRFRTHFQTAATEHPRVGDRAAVSRAPAVVDVMGGICEEGGSLVLTATLGIAVRIGCWQTQGRELTIRFHGPSDDGTPRTFAMPMASLGAGEPIGGAVLAACTRANAAWAAPICLAVHRAIHEEAIPRPAGGLMVLVHSDFPAGSDLGSPCATAAAVIDALARLFGVEIDRFRRAAIAAHSVSVITGMPRLRIAMTSLCGAPDGSLLQLRFLPQFSCEPLALPAGVTISAVRTTLARPTTIERIQETRLCAEMGTRMIHELRRKEAAAADARTAHLAAITPAEYVERYRDQLPSKITAQAFVARFGEVRGLDPATNPREVYKVRSRAEHHIYENRRVHDFVTNIVRARRTPSPESLIQAGELMYASHWSHSQRCGIGGVESDKLVHFIRQRGAKDGLFGAKVTGGGEGGEIVVLMRDDDASRAALAAAVEDAGAACGRPIEVFHGSLAGLEYFEPTEMADLLGAPAAV